MVKMKNPFKLFYKWVAIRYVEMMKRKFEIEEYNEGSLSDIFCHKKHIEVCDKMLAELKK
jgi:hypothetical protein